MDKEIVMYVRRAFCPNVALARDVLNRHNIPYREVFIDKDPAMADRVKEWTNFYSVPTIILANPGEEVPYTEFLPRPTDLQLNLTEANARIPAIRIQGRANRFGASRFDLKRLAIDTFFCDAVHQRRHYNNNVLL